MTKERRRFDRFRVTEPKTVRARILQASDRNAFIQSIGAGGCGFVSSRANARLLMNPRVEVELNIGGQNFKLSGKVQYCQLLPSKGADRNMLGIQFDWPDSFEREAFEMLLRRSFKSGALHYETDLQDGQVAP